MPGPPLGQELRLDLTGLRAEYVAPTRTASLRRSALQLSVLVLALVGALVVAVAREGWGGLVQLVVTSGAVGVAVVLVDRARGRPRTLLRADELGVRDRSAFGDRYGWWWVREVRCRPGRATPGTAVLQDGRRLRLVGMPVEDVERLARALRAAREGTGG